MSFCIAGLTEYCVVSDECEHPGLGDDLAALVSSSLRALALEGLEETSVHAAAAVALRSAEVTVADLEFPAVRRSLSRSHCK